MKVPTIIKEMEYKCTPSYKNMALREQSPIDSFHQEEVIGSYDGEPSVSFVNPIQMLFNQIRLDNIGEQSLKQWLEGQPQDSAVAELLKKCDVDDIMDTIKSRYLQHPCEIRAWAEYCAHNMERFNSSVKDAIEQQQAQTSVNVESSNSE